MTSIWAKLTGLFPGVKGRRARQAADERALRNRPPGGVVYVSPETLRRPLPPRRRSYDASPVPAPSSSTDFLTAAALMHAALSQRVEACPAPEPFRSEGGGDFGGAGAGGSWEAPAPSPSNDSGSSSSPDSGSSYSSDSSSSSDSGSSSCSSSGD